MKKLKSVTSDNETARLLSIIAKLLGKVTAQDLAHYISQEVTVAKIKAFRNVEEPVNQLFDFKPTRNVDLSSIANGLKSLNTRDEGYSLLSSNDLNRKELEGIGRLLGTPILKTDNMDRLTQKIIEASIGSRLNSKAIRGKDSGIE